MHYVRMLRRRRRRRRRRYKYHFIMGWGICCRKLAYMDELFGRLSRWYV